MKRSAQKEGDATLVFSNFARANNDTVRIVLTMIVRNESAIISRCYNSVRNIIDAAVICDTGSTDQTVEIVRSFVRHIPSAVYSHEWKDFGHNRSLSAQCAVDFVRRMGWNLSRTYMLFVDADMILRVRSDFSKDILSRVGYMVQQDAHGTVYSNIRLARCDAKWLCTGVTHEYWTPTVLREETRENNGEFRPMMLPHLVIDDRNDGGCKADKFVRDARLLERGLVEEPTNVRYMFYLAQTYADLANKLSESKASDSSNVHITRTFGCALSDESVTYARRAIEYYERRVQAGGWEEEIYFSLYRIGMMWEALRDYTQAEENYRRAVASRPLRGEARCSLGRLLRFLQRYDDALRTCEELNALPICTDVLFVNKLCYRLYPTQDIAYIGYLTKGDARYYEQGFAACERLVSDLSLVSMLQQSDAKTFEVKLREYHCILASYCQPLVQAPEREAREASVATDTNPQPDREQVQVTLTESGCSDSESSEDESPDDIVVVPIRNDFDFADTPVANRLYPTNPSIIPHPTASEKFLMNVRLVNYFIQKPLVYTFPHAEDRQTVFTRNALITVDMDEGELLEPRLVEDASRVPWSRVENNIVGLEDVRLFNFRGRVWCTFTSCQAHASKRPQICLGRLNTELDSVEHAVLLTGDFTQPDEKNWLPFVVTVTDEGRDQEQLRILYSSDPTIVLQVNEDTGQCTILHKNPTRIRLSFLRGSCAPIRYNRGATKTWLFVTHEVVYLGQDRVYMHRFVEMSDNFVIVRRSRPFTFFGRQVEFACGMCFLNEEQSHLLLTFGLWDREAYLLQLSTTKIESLLRPLEEF